MRLSLLRSSWRPKAAIQWATLGLLVSTLAGACSGSKRYAKKASQLDQSGLYAEAADLYYQSLVRNSGNVEAKIGFKKVGQQLLNDKLSTFFKYFSTGEKAEAVNAYLAAKDYQAQAQRVGVVLEIPDHNRADFESVKGVYLVELYERGEGLMEKQDFKGAEQVFKRIGELEPGYRDANSLENVAYLEPLYRSGKQAYEEGHYRKAWTDLDRVVKKDAAYKDSRELRDDAVKKGQYSVAVVPFTHAGDRRDVAQRLHALAIAALVEVDDPFLKVVDRENMDRILAEQRLGLSGVVDEQTAVQVGNLIGAKAVLMGTVLEYREEVGRMVSTPRQGFESYRVKETDPVTKQESFVTKFRPAKYTEHTRQDRATISVSYKLVSLATGEVLLSKVVEEQALDQLRYAAYEGVASNLYPARDGVVDTSEQARRSLQGLLSASRAPKSMSDLTNGMLRTACGRMASALQQDMLALLP
jgi:tetratricopeptide (TPR) repeat protein